jgi:hypothetical protein
MRISRGREEVIGGQDVRENVARRPRKRHMTLNMYKKKEDTEIG